ncbi:hypothetical protein, partial [Acidovorax delafieldii]|uniref:hypothetical protein n=1 Tax=Acidovorax delafieldii TaxID=47920 RepID=UPI003F503C63
THSNLRMIYLAITSEGLAQALRVAKNDDAVWCGADAISETAWAALPAPSCTRFVYELGDGVLVDDAVSTIEEHHPGQTIWIEATSPP